MDDVSDDRHRYRCSRRWRKPFRIASSPAITPTSVIAIFDGIHPRHQQTSSSAISVRSAAAGAPSAARTASPRTVCINDGDTHNSPNEQVEAKFPVLVERYALLPDSGGAGRHRGGLGVERVVRARTELTFNSQIERHHCRPWGLSGGGDGKGNAVSLRLMVRGRPISPMPRCWSRTSNPAMPSACARAAAAAMARRWSGRGRCVPRRAPRLCIGRGSGGTVRGGHRPADQRSERESHRTAAGGRRQ